MKTASKLSSVLCGISIAWLIASSGIAAVRYVDAEAMGSGTGADWANAYANIQAAVTASSAGDEIWVAAGVYMATADPVFTMKAGVRIYGGFAKTESSPADRNWESNASVVDGEQVRRCVVGASNALLDGFIIQGGRAAQYGGGMYAVNCTGLIVSNCIFSENVSASTQWPHGGGGLYCTGGAVTVSNSTFTMNTAANGGGMAGANGV